MLYLTMLWIKSPKTLNIVKLNYLIQGTSQTSKKEPTEWRKIIARCSTTPLIVIILWSQCDYYLK